MPTDQEPHETPQQPQRAQEDDDTLALSVVDFIDSMDRLAFRRALDQRFNYYRIVRVD
jgi:hypothetical protein